MEISLTVKFGDNLFTLSAGLTFNIGKVGWKKVVDAASYINQNKWLVDCMDSTGYRICPKNNYSGLKESIRDE